MKSQIQKDLGVFLLLIFKPPHNMHISANVYLRRLMIEIRFDLKQSFRIMLDARILFPYLKNRYLYNDDHQF